MNRKKELIKSAIDHTADMNICYSDEIDAAIHNTEIFRDDPQFRKRVKNLPKEPKNTVNQQIIDYDLSVGMFEPLILEAIKAGKRVAVLVPASFKNPGGSYIKGSLYPESRVCWNSFLYNVQKAFEREYYIPNQRDTFKCLYNNSAMYSAGIRFWEQENIYPTPIPAPDNLKTTIVDVISCSPPNLRAAHQYYQVYSGIQQVYRSRVEFIKNICELNKVDILLADSFGCEVGKFDGYVAAKIFNEVFKESTSISSIYYTIRKYHRRGDYMFYSSILRHQDTF